MPKMREVLVDYAWKWMGRSVTQDGDPVGRHVIHVIRRRPVAYLLMQPPGYGTSSLASRLFVPAGLAVVLVDQHLSLAGAVTPVCPATLRRLTHAAPSPFFLHHT